MKRLISTYREVLATTRPVCPDSWHILWTAFETASLAEKKAGILLFRARHFPTDPESTLYRLTLPFINFARSVLPDTWDDVVSSLLDYPDVAAFSLSMILSSPYPDWVIADIFQSMVSKEMAAMESTERPNGIDWSALQTLSVPLSSDHRPAPDTYRLFRSAFNRWISKLSRTLILPYSSRKSLSRSTLRDFNRLSGNSFESVNPLQLEQYYCETGVKVGGVCEMRQVWYPTIATPRTYYAMGGDAYFRSRYLRDIFNYLADYIPCTNRHLRVDPSHLTVESDEDTFVYDLTSFTSLFHEQRHFLDFIAGICCDVEVEVLDTHHGILRVSLEELIHEYNELNKHPTYSLERMGFDIELQHSIAGFLGVYANLVTCTFAHGLNLMTMTDSVNKQWCAGDDAGTLHKRDDRSFKVDMQNTLDKIGVIQWEKTYSDSEGDPAVALKRRLIRLPGLLALSPNILFPPFSTMFKDDPRFERQHGDSDEDLLSRFCSGLMSMLYQMSITHWEQTDVSFLRVLLPALYTRLHLPSLGWFPPLCGYGSMSSGHRLSFAVPRIVGEFWKNDPTKELLDAYMPLTYAGRVYSEMRWDGMIADEFMCNSSPILKVAVSMGFLEREEVRVVYHLNEDVQLAVYRDYLKSMASASDVLYRFKRVCKCPDWVC